MAKGFLRRKKGFTLIELLVVVLIIGILAAIAVPQYFKVVEKGKAAEALAWLQSLKGAQETYLARRGQYSSQVSLLDVNVAAMKNFNMPSSISVAGSSAAAPTWSVGVVRNIAHAVYGAYTVQFTGPSGSMSCTPTACANDLLPY